MSATQVDETDYAAVAANAREAGRWLVEIDELLGAAGALRQAVAARAAGES